MYGQPLPPPPPPTHNTVHIMAPQPQVQQYGTMQPQVQYMQPQPQVQQSGPSNVIQLNNGNGNSESKGCKWCDTPGRACCSICVIFWIIVLVFFIILCASGCLAWAKAVEEHNNRLRRLR